MAERVRFSFALRQSLWNKGLRNVDRLISNTPEPLAQFRDPLEKRINLLAAWLWSAAKLADNHEGTARRGFRGARSRFAACHRARTRRPVLQPRSHPGPPEPRQVRQDRRARGFAGAEMGERRVAFGGGIGGGGSGKIARSCKLSRSICPETSTGAVNALNRRDWSRKCSKTRLPTQGINPGEYLPKGVVQKLNRSDFAHVFKY